jgi:hypothetical protein
LCSQLLCWYLVMVHFASTWGSTLCMVLGMVHLTHHVPRGSLLLPRRPSRVWWIMQGGGGGNFYYTFHEQVHPLLFSHPACFFFVILVIYPLIILRKQVDPSDLVIQMTCPFRRPVCFPSSHPSIHRSIPALLIILLTSSFVVFWENSFVVLRSTQSNHPSLRRILPAL